MNNLTKEVNKALMEYKKKCSEEVYIAAQEAAEIAKAKLKTEGGYQDDRGKYRKGFTIKKYEHYIYPAVTIHNKEYRLTHLLEHGHMKANGTERTKAFPHWEAAEKVAVETFEKRIEERISDIEV